MASLNITSTLSNGEQAVSAEKAKVEVIVEKEIQIVEKPVYKILERTIEVPVFIDKIVEVQVEKIVERIVEVEKRVEVIVEKIKEVPVQVEKMVQGPIQKVLVTVHKIPPAMWWVVMLESLIIAALIHYLAMK